MINIYFAGSIRGGRHLAERYQKIIAMLQLHGNVYTEHVGDNSLIDRDNEHLSDEEIHDRDMDWIGKSDLMVAEVSLPSLGVGYEIARAICSGIPVLCLYDENAAHRLSAMIAGSDEIKLVKYKSPERLEHEISGFIAANTL